MILLNIFKITDIWIVVYIEINHFFDKRFKKKKKERKNARRCVRKIIKIQRRRNLLFVPQLNFNGYDRSNRCHNADLAKPRSLWMNMATYLCA